LKCPICKTGELFLYKETESVYRIPLTKRNTLSKRKSDNIPQVFGTSKDYLECNNSNCGELFDYDLDEKGRVIDVEERYHQAY